MIKFFRKIRQRLLTENKFSKYLLYAIGEIVLVVIGILIALSINNRNETKKKEVKEKQHYSNILNDLIIDNEYIVEFIEILTNKQDLHYLLYDIIKTKKSRDTIVTLSRLLFTSKFEPNTSRNQTSIIDVINSNEVRVVLNNYIREENIAIVNTEDVRNFTKNNVRPYMYLKEAVNIDSIFIKSRYDNSGMLSSSLINYKILSTSFDDYEFKTLLMGLRMQTSSTIKILYDLLEENQALQELLIKKLE